MMSVSRAGSCRSMTPHSVSAMATTAAGMRHTLANSSSRYALMQSHRQYSAQQAYFTSCAKPHSFRVSSVPSSIPRSLPSHLQRELRHSFSSSAHSVPANATPIELYNNNIKTGQYRDDPRQRYTVELLDQTFQQLLDAKQNGGRKRSSLFSSQSAAPAAAAAAAATPAPASGGFFGGFFGSKKNSKTASAPAASTALAPVSDSPFHGITGLYLHGGVGSGKTMLMNMFYDCVHARITQKSVRKHFHSFMLDIHRRLHEIRKSHPGMTDPIAHVAQEFAAQECEVLCLDEFQVTDVADAMILKQLFGTLWLEGCVVVSTSNRPPEDLYKNGLNRSVFLPFIDDLKKQCKVHAMEEGQDHRLLGTIAEGVYQSPINDATSAAMRGTFDRLAGSTDPDRRGSTKIKVMMGREMQVPLASKNGNVAQFTFHELCETNVGAADYLALVSQYKYILITNIPILYFHQREKIRRFITFLDVAYEQHARLILQADEVPLKLFQAPTSEMISGIAANSADVDPNSTVREFEGVRGGVTDTRAAGVTKQEVAPVGTAGATSAATTAGAKYDEQFASSRAISRLIEMSSKEYLQACAKERDAEKSAAELAFAPAPGEAAQGSRTAQYLENEKAARVATAMA